MLSVLTYIINYNTRMVDVHGFRGADKTWGALTFN